MEPLIDVLLYLVTICAAVLIGGAAIYGIHNMCNRIRRANARLIWCTVAKHRRRHDGSVL